MPTMTTELTESGLLALIANRRRRLLLTLLAEWPSTSSARELATILADREDDDLRTIYISLVHHHLPKLDDTAVIEYDHDSGDVTPGPNFGVVIGALDEWNAMNESFVGT